MTIYVNARAIIERETGTETEILLQTRVRPGEPERLEFPGGQIEPFEPVFSALGREIEEETGLQLSLVHERDSHVSHQGGQATVETFQPFFAYQTVEGPIDSLGFYFRCQTRGAVIETGDGSREPAWYPISEIKQVFQQNPERFDWLTQAALERYLEWHRVRPG